MIWKWRKGDATTQADFGVPTGSAAYTLTLYTGTTATLLVQAYVPPDADKWSPLGDKGWKYKDKFAESDGIRKMILKGGAAGKAKITVKGKGAELPDLPGGTLPLDGDDFPITLQLFNSGTEECWESAFGVDDIRRNESTRLKLRTRN